MWEREVLQGLVAVMVRWAGGVTEVEVVAMDMQPEAVVVERQCYSTARHL
jgi:hypothetical protein